MTGRSPDAAERAAALLGVPDGAGTAEARAAFLRRLEEAEFVPPPACLAAYEALAGRRLAGGAEAEPEGGAEAEHLRGEVEALAADFFRLPAALRRGRWQALAERCRPRPALAARLNELAPGLAAEPLAVHDPDPLVTRLAGHIGELFVLRPAARAARRLELLGRMRQDVLAWEAAARALERRHEGVAELEPGLVQYLAGWSVRRRDLAAAHARPAGAARPAAVGKSAPRWPVILAIWGALALGRLACTGTSGPSPYRPEPPAVPQFDWRQWNDDVNKQLQDALKEARQPRPEQDLHGPKGGNDALERLRRDHPDLFPPRQPGRDGVPPAEPPDPDRPADNEPPP